MLRATLFLCLCFCLPACGSGLSTLEQVKKEGKLIVATRNGPTTYYTARNGPAGLEHELVSLFADDLGVDVKWVFATNHKDLLPLVTKGKVHMAAAGLSVTVARRQLVRFTPDYQTITPQLIYRLGTPRPKNLSELHGTLEVMAGSSHIEELNRLSAEYPKLSWQENSELGSETLLYLVWEKLIDYTIAASHEVRLTRGFYPELRIAFDLNDPQKLAWALARSDDDSLYQEASRFINRIREDGTLEQLLDRYYGHVEDFDYVGTRRYLSHINQRLPLYRDMFLRTGEQHDIDWRLLAAIGYQESHWNPEAVSPTGVRGIMMLTQNAMKDLGIKNRIDPAQSIAGGAKYFLKVKKKIPKRIQEPDRTWLALAAYNVGFGHLEDARILAQKNGDDPDKWVSVKKYLPLLSQKKWYSQTRHGYARGAEPVRYVRNVRTYYDILAWITDQDEPWSLEPKTFAADFSAL